ncbi:hypothetical protein tinsulaeT_05900 [Thalassotalea insulae]|uniref:Solute-binding protein family 3/N-terminal domain-containing protein n=1 Tax=Thalassotalea insulae TaxID=2056778 RepID=A0ABQ6GMN0_9GAMM|nr:transporter substrate-binding domain-containing protein [Thalassotalea insulae]GLX77250.1 hypothetical protein tinsulaeT_05900 [Thalassotalea insulae]
MQIQSLFCLFLLLVLPLFSEAKQTEETIEMVAGLAKAPFITDEQGHGMQLDILKAALAFDELDVKFLQMPLGRNITGFQRLNADGVTTLPQDYQHPALHLSTPYISYQNVAVSLAESQLSIEKIADLSGKHVVAFQNARKFLGDKYSETVAYLLDYREIGDQKQQIEMLFLRRAEVIILDTNILKYFIKHHHQAIYDKPITVHYIFNQRNYVAGFRSPAIRDKFNRGIKRLKENGSYQDMLNNYLN